MKVFVTGATGHIGGAVADRLLRAGHEVLGLARSAEAEAALRARGIEPHAGSLEDLASLRAGARAADAVVNAGSLMSFGPERGQVEQAAVAAMLEAMEGTGRTFVYTSDQLVYGPTPNGPADEDTPLNPLPFVAWRPGVERMVLAAAARDVRPLVMRPCAVHGHGRDHLLPMLIAAARREGSASYIGDGSVRWSLVHVDDVADAYARALEHAPAGTVLNVAPEQPTTTREIARAAQRAAGLAGEPRSVSLAEAEAVLGPFARNFTFDLTISAVRARRLLGWRAHGPTLLEEAAAGVYPVEDTTPAP